SQKGSITPSKQDGKIRCACYPKCRKFHTDKSFHPTENCKILSSTGTCAKGDRCFFLHVPCPNDGACEDMNCIYEHFKITTTVKRIIEFAKLAAKKGANQGSLPRVPSMSNISSASGFSISGRRKSATFGFDSDEDEKLLKKESTSKKS
ncbi:hypothetical protein PMAYCL1PPCAC_09335, partial [Pristionchus mayeri]